MDWFLTRARLKNEYGASLAAAILFFVLCAVCASMILAAASASAGKMEQVPQADRKRLAVESAAAFLRDEIQRPTNAVHVVEVLVEDSRRSDPVSDTVSFSYAGGEGGETPGEGDTASGDSFLRSFVKSQYEPMLDQCSFSQTEGSDKRTFSMTVTEQDGTKKKTVTDLAVDVTLTVAPDYGLTALISDTVTPEDSPEDLCRRKLVIPAKETTDTDVSVEYGKETDDEGNIIDEWTITTTTKTTEIAWERGMITEP